MTTTVLQVAPTAPANWELEHESAYLKMVNKAPAVVELKERLSSIEERLGDIEERLGELIAAKKRKSGSGKPADEATAAGSTAVSETALKKPKV